MITLVYLISWAIECNQYLQDTLRGDVPKGVLGDKFFSGKNGETFLCSPKNLILLRVLLDSYRILQLKIFLK